jgi:hypothetical protein
MARRQTLVFLEDTNPACTGAPWWRDLHLAPNRATGLLAGAVTTQQTFDHNVLSIQPHGEANPCHR